MPQIKIKRVYETKSPEDGFRIYVDRLWPRGLSHETFHCDLWDKEIAPSTALRHWFHEDPVGRWCEFKRKYLDELETNPAVAGLRQIIAGVNLNANILMSWKQIRQLPVCGKSLKSSLL